MPVDVVLLVVTALLATVAVGAAVIAVRALRDVRRTAAAESVESVAPEVSEEIEAFDAGTEEDDTRPVTVVEGRVVALLSHDDLLEARLSRPSVRLSVYAHGIAHALRPESRDRIVALVRREYRRRRAVRLKIARRALRSVPSDALRKQPDWLGGNDAPQLPRVVGE